MKKGRHGVDAFYEIKDRKVPPPEAWRVSAETKPWPREHPATEVRDTGTDLIYRGIGGKHIRNY
jgi:hypothetical protein